MFLAKFVNPSNILTSSLKLVHAISASLLSCISNLASALPKDMGTGVLIGRGDLGAVEPPIKIQTCFISKSIPWFANDAEITWFCSFFLPFAHYARSGTPSERRGHVLSPHFFRFHQKPFLHRTSATFVSNICHFPSFHLWWVRFFRCEKFPISPLIFLSFFTLTHAPFPFNNCTFSFVIRTPFPFS